MKPFCKKCLLEDMDTNAELQNILDYIKEIPADRRAADELYRRRLNICRGCNSLANGICGKCGCYVELRAAKKDMYCASEDKKW